MSSELIVVSVCAYLTEISTPWRPEDHTTSKMVKALKGDDLNGYFEATVKGSKKRFDNSNAEHFRGLVPGAIYKAIRSVYDNDAVLVPIPNSNVTDPDQDDFKTFILAKAIAEKSKGGLSAIPALVFKGAQQKSRDGGPRSPYYFESVYKVARKIEGNIILIDDVVTSGGHLIGACWKLNSSSRRVVLGASFGSSTKEQIEHPFGIRQQTLNLDKVIPSFS